MIASFSQKIELRFWDVAILMLTRSKPVRSIVSTVLKIYQNELLTKKIASVFIIACAGFATGIIAFTIRSLF